MFTLAGLGAILSFSEGQIALGALLALAFGVWLLLAGRGIRYRYGLGNGKTVSLDNVTLTSQLLGLTGRPDRLIKRDGLIIPEEWKSSSRPRPSHRVQLGTYFLLIEEQLRIRPPHGFIVCGDSSRHRVENTPELRSLVLDIAARIRMARANPSQPIATQPNRGKCQPCGMRRHCGQRG